MPREEEITEVLEQLKVPYSTPNQGEWNPQTPWQFRGEPQILELQSEAKYGTNPHQQTAFYAPLSHTPIIKAVKEGKGGASETNWDDANEGLYLMRLAHELRPGMPSAAVMKHLNQSGWAMDEDATQAFVNAWNGDPQAAYGGTAVFNTELTEDELDFLKGKFIDVVVAPKYTDEARKRLEKRKNLRAFEYDLDRLRSINIFAPTEHVDTKTYIDGTVRATTHYWEPIKPDNLGHVVTEREPTPHEREQLTFAGYLASSLRSNGVGIADDFMALAAGTGQQKRNGAIEQAIALARWSAEQRGISPHEVLEGAVLGSDGFLPNVDNVQLAADAGIAAIIQPGGSGKDLEVVRACNAHGIAMVMTGYRSFRHK